MLLAGYFTTFVFTASSTHLNSDLQDFIEGLDSPQTAVSTNHILPYNAQSVTSGLVFSMLNQVI